MPSIQLKDGSTASDPRLGRIVEQDLRSLNFLVSQRPEVSEGMKHRPRSYTWSVDAWLDQGVDGACVGFGFAHDFIARPYVVSGLDNDYARRLYWRIQTEDPWPGGAYPGASPFYEGTSVLTGAKVCTDLGYYFGYDWALDALEVAAGIGYDGPCILGLDWFTGMFDPDAGGFLRPTGRVEGGHCLLAIGVKIVYKRESVLKTLFWWTRTWDDVDMERSYVVLHNSWGPSWGDNGRAKLTLSDLDFLLKQQGDACFPRRRTSGKIHF